MSYGVLVNGVDVSDYIYNLRYSINQDALQVSGGCESDLEFEINDEIALFEDGVLRFKARIKSREKELLTGWKSYYRYEFAFTFQNLKRGVIKISKEEHEGGQTKDFLENLLADAGIDYSYIGGVNSTSIIFETMSPEASTISVAPNLAAQGLSFTENWAYFIKDNKLYITDSDLHALPHEDLTPQEFINPKIRKVNKVATKGKFVARYNAFSTSFNSSGDAAAYGEQKLEQNLTFLNEKNAENVQNNFSMFSYPFTVLEFEFDRFLDPLKFYRILIGNKPEFADILGDYYIQEENHELNEGRVEHKYRLKQFKAFLNPQNHISFVVYHQRGGRRIQAFGGGGGSGVNILSKVGQMNSTLPTAADAGKIETTGQTGGGALPEIDKTATFLLSMTNAENMRTEWRQMQIFGLEDDSEFVKANEGNLQKGYGLITSTLSLPSGEYSLVWTFRQIPQPAKAQVASNNNGFSFTATNGIFWQNDSAEVYENYEYPKPVFSLLSIRESNGEKIERYIRFDLQRILFGHENESGNKALMSLGLYSGDSNQDAFREGSNEVNAGFAVSGGSSTIKFIANNGIYWDGEATYMQLKSNSGIPGGAAFELGFINTYNEERQVISITEDATHSIHMDYGEFSIRSETGYSFIEANAIPGSSILFDNSGFHVLDAQGSNSYFSIATSSGTPVIGMDSNGISIDFDNGELHIDGKTGFTGTVRIVTSVNFENQTVIKGNLNFYKGILTSFT